MVRLWRWEAVDGEGRGVQAAKTHRNECERLIYEAAVVTLPPPLEV